MESLTVVIITYNEEKNIARCIDQAKKIGDEIIVFDSYSSDNTPLIARQKGVVFHQQAFPGYGAQKNAAALLASFNYVLFLDADEFPSEALCRLIQLEKQKGFPADGYTMNRLNNYCGQWIRHGAWYPDKKLRLINRLKGYWNDHLVHETIEMQGSSPVLHLRADLMHYAYQSMHDHVDKNNRYSDLSAELMHRQGKKTSLLKMLLNPAWAFLNGYLFRLGFLDGFYGWVIAVNVAHLTFLKHSKLLELQRNQKPSPNT
jgi:glycosyltransferase involved in cell wall biosynthesis